MIECSALERIQARNIEQLAQLEWALEYKRRLRDLCVERDEIAQAKELDRELDDLSAKLLACYAAAELVRAAL